MKYDTSVGCSKSGETARKKQGASNKQNGSMFWKGEPAVAETNLSPDFTNNKR